MWSRKPNLTLEELPKDIRRAINNASSLLISPNAVAQALTPEAWFQRVEYKEGWKGTLYYEIHGIIDAGEFVTKFSFRPNHD